MTQPKETGEFQFHGISKKAEDLIMDTTHPDSLFELVQPAPEYPIPYADTTPVTINDDPNRIRFASFTREPVLTEAEEDRVENIQNGMGVSREDAITMVTGVEPARLGAKALKRRFAPTKAFRPSTRGGRSFPEVSDSERDPNWANANGARLSTEQLTSLRQQADAARDTADQTQIAQGEAVNRVAALRIIRDEKLGR